MNSDGHYYSNRCPIFCIEILTKSMKTLNEDIHSPNIILTSNIHNSIFTTLPSSTSPNIVTSLSSDKTYHRKSRYKEFHTDNQIYSIYVNKVIHISQKVAVTSKNCYRIVTKFKE